MAVAGDIIINFAANFASFSDAMKTATKSLDDFSKQGASIQSTLEGFASKLQTAFKTGVVLAAINEVRKYAEELYKTSVEIEKLATKHKLTSEQVQGLQAVAKGTGLSFEELAKQFGKNQQKLLEFTDAAKLTGQMIDGQITKSMKNLGDESDKAWIKAKWLFSSTGGDSMVAKMIDMAANAIRNLGNALTFVSSKELAIKFVIAAATGNWAAIAYMVGGMAAAPPGAQALDDVQKNLSRARDELEKINAEIAKSGGTSGGRGDPFAQQRDRILGGGGIGANAADLEARKRNAEKAIAEGEAQLADIQERIKLQSARNRKLDEAQQTLTGTTVPTTTTATGGGGKTDSDNLQAQIERYRALAKATGEASEAIEKQRKEKGLLYDDLQREAKIQQQINSIAEKLGAKYRDADPALKQQLRDEITLYERRKEAQEKWLEAVRQAEDLNNRLGSGDIARRRRDELLERMGRGGAEPDALRRFRKESDEQLEQSRLAAKRFDDNFESMAAGFESAANAYARANDMFNFGNQAFSGVVNAMGEALDVLSGKSSKTFAQVAADFATMLSKMAAQMAISEAFKFLVSLLGASFGSSTAQPLATSLYGSSSSVVPPLTYGGPRAIGGAVYPGQFYTVGEGGPETFVPTVAGNIRPYGSQAATSDGGVTVNLDMKRAEGARDPAAALEFGRRVRQAVRTVIENEKRPGGTLYFRATA